MNQSPRHGTAPPPKLPHSFQQDADLFFSRKSWVAGLFLAADQGLCGILERVAVLDDSVFLETAFMGSFSSSYLFVLETVAYRPTRPTPIPLKSNNPLRLPELNKSTSCEDL